MSETKEVWKPIPDYGDYEVSNLGRVRSLKYGKELVMKPIKNSRGYLNVNLCKNGKHKPFTIHSLVAMAFLDHVPKGMSSVVDHIDGDQFNNKLENLRIVSQRENTTFGFLKKSTSSKYPGVSWNKNAKKWRVYIYINGKLKHLGYFNTEEEAGRAYQEKLNELNGIRDKSYHSF